jgi:uncharacterized protein (TIGR00251 family)
MMMFEVLAKPNSKIDTVEWKNDLLQLKIKAKPIDGEANKYIIIYLSKILGVSHYSIKIIKGQFSKHKAIEVPLELEEVKNILSNTCNLRRL